MHKITLFLLTFWSISVFAQTNLSRSLSTGSDKNHFQDVRLMTDSTVSLVGYAIPPTSLTQNTDIILAITDKLTNVKKSLLIGDSSFETGRAHLIDKQGDVIVLASRSASEFNSQTSTLIIKLDGNWNMKWAKMFSIGNYTTDPNFCKQLMDGNYLLGGVTNPTSGWLCKMDTGGNVIWSKTYTRNSAGFNSVEEDNNGNLYVTGYQYGGNSTGFVLKLNSLGNIIWDGSIVHWQYLCGRLGKDGNLYVVGEAGSNSSTHGFMIQKYDASNGARVWVRKLNNYLGGHIAFDLCFDENGFIYVLGAGTSSSSRTHILKMNEQGALIKHITIVPSTILVNFRDNQSIQYDTLEHKLWISATGSKNSQENYLFMVDTGLSNASCLTTRSFPIDTSMASGVVGGESVTTIALVTPSIQSIIIPTRTISLGSLLSCSNCAPVIVANTFTYLDSSTVTFTNKSDTSNGRTFKWAFGDGHTSTLLNPSHTYTTKGTFQVKLVSTSSNGICMDSITKSVKIEGRPTAKFTAPNTCFYNKITFTNQSTVSSPGTITKRCWYFGNGDTSTILSPVYKYATPGQYMVKLVIETETGRKDSVEKMIFAHPKPVANYSYTLPCQKDSINFTNTSTVTTGKIVSGIWTWGSKTLNGLNVKLSLTDTGNYSLRMICISDSACRDTIIKTIHVNAKPFVGFTMSGLPKQCFRNNSFTFTDTTRLSETNLNAFWILHTDTVISTELVHSFASGIFTVKRVSISTEGCKDSALRTVEVFNQPLLPLITGDSFPIKQSIQSYKVKDNTKSLYHWQITGGTMISGQGKSDISVQWGSTLGAAQILTIETDSNGCVSDTAGSNILVGNYRLEINPDSIKADSGISTGNIVTLLSDSAWTGSTSEAWIHFSPASGTGNSNVIVNLDANIGSARQGLITFVSGAITRNVIVTQEDGLSTGIEDPDQNRQNITLYPNPGRNIFTITFTGLPLQKKITITDLCGKEVYAAFSEQTDEFTFSAQTFATGIFLVKVESSEKVYHAKLMVCD